MRKLDLHGFTLEDAYQEFTDFIYEAYQGSIPKVEVITGKSGQIRKEFPQGLTLTEFIEKRFGVGILKISLFLIFFYMTIFLIAEVTEINGIENRIEQILANLLEFN